MTFPPNSSWKKEMAIEHVAGTGRGEGSDIATDSRDKGGCLSLYVHLGGWI